ncbi:MAG: septation protein SepH [Candidatus Nanopelagicales bacterium]|jgi:hypothetical protein|nr:septation protein SepH [Candidatus Nanopelagicales bacterium]
MRELTFDGLSPDGSRLVLAGKDGQKYTVEIDERLSAAVRRDRARMGQVELEQSGQLRPREIQARIRAGATAEDVAAASGLPLEHVRRFEGPVLTERAWVAQQAQATEVRRPGGDIELGDVVSERLHAAGVDPADIAWDAWRRDDGLWVVIATFPLPPNVHVATWTYDSGNRTMTVADDNARALSAITSEEPLHLVPNRPVLAAVAPVADDEDDEYADRPVAILTPRPGRGGRADGAAEDDAALAGALEAELDEEREQEAIDEAAVAGLHDPEEEPEAGEALAEDGSQDAADERGDAADAEAGAEPSDEGDGPTTDAEDVPLFDAPPRPTPARGARPAVPSFDDILFGPGPKHQD